MRSRSKKSDESPWGYAVAGVVALAFASLIQFALGELPHNVLKYVPIGKLVLTVPLAAWGVALIARDLVANFGRRPARVARTRSEPAPRETPSATAPAAVADSGSVSDEELGSELVPEFAADGELDLEVGEPLEEDMGPKIPALRGRFTWLLGDESYKPGARRGEA